MERLTLNNILNINELNSELEYERATSIYLKLRKMDNKDEYYSNIRKHIKELLKNYENEHWSDEDTITDAQVKESDIAELLVQAENTFYYNRKKLIKQELKKAKINQNELAIILGHSKGYMSELINGLRPLSKEDIVIINRLFKIKLEDLTPPFLKEEKAIHIRKTLKSLPQSNIKLSIKDIEIQPA